LEWSAVVLLERLPRIALASSVAFVTDLSILIVATHAGAPPWLAALVACTAGGAANFAVSRRHVFKDVAPGSTLDRAVRYGVLVVLGGAVITALLVQLGVSLGLPLLVTRIAVGMLVMLGWGYPVSSRVVFTEERHALS
jgi:putative flippase GtrA